MRVITDEMRSLANSPEPPDESEGGFDCRAGGACGLGGFIETRRSRWINARFWLRREQQQKEQPLPAIQPKRTRWQS